MQMSEGAARTWLRVLGAYHLALGALQALAPGTFFESFAGYGTRNDHYIRDVSTFYLALGGVLLLAAARPAWRGPVLFFAALQYVLHAVNHLVDIGESDPGWVGPFNFVAVLALAGVLGYLLHSAPRRLR